MISSPTTAEAKITEVAVVARTRIAPRLLPKKRVVTQ